MKRLTVGVCLALVILLVCGSAFAITMQKGTKGMNVPYLQARLKALGYDVEINMNAVYDDATVAAVKKFQEDHGLKAKGTVNDETWNAIFNEPYSFMKSTGGIGSRTYSIHGTLVPPFSTVEVSKDSNDPHVEFLVDNFKCLLYVDSGESMDAFVQQEQQDDRGYFDKYFVTEYAGKKFEISGKQSFKVNGKPAQVWMVSWNFVNGAELYHYSFRGVIELDKIDGKQMFANVFLTYNVEPSMSVVKEVLGINAVKAVLSGIYCDRDRLAEYQAGAAQRKKASKLKITLPEFQPVDGKEQTLLNIVYTLRDYVDPAADGASGELDANTCVSMYYGVSIMEYYMDAIDSGNKPSDARMLSVMSLANGVFDDSYKEGLAETREKVRAAMSAAKLALKKENAAYLTLLGLETPRWTAEERDALEGSILRTMDRTLGKKEPTLENVKFDKATELIETEVQIVAETSTDAEALQMYVGDKLVKTWTDGYTDQGSARIWKVKYAFKSKGNRTLTFKATNNLGQSEAKDATIKIVDTLPPPTLTSVQFGTETATVDTEVPIIAVTSADAAELEMFADGKRIVSFTEGYTDSGDTRTWKVKYAFKGKGNRTLTFRAVNPYGASAEMSASIRIKDPVSIPTLISAVFAEEEAEVKKDVTIIAVTSTDAETLNLFAGSKLIQTWTEGYSDKGGTRTWRVKYAFNGRGDRTVTFRAGNEAGLSEGTDASIIVK